jgi:anti-anti-sigma factor
MLTITRTEVAHAHVYVIDGRVDTDGAYQLEKRLNESIDNAHYELVLDLSQTNYLNSAGLRILADALTRCRQQGGNVKLAAPNIKVMRVLEIIGFDKFFEIFPTVEKAVHG